MFIYMIKPATFRWNTHISRVADSGIVQVSLATGRGTSRLQRDETCQPFLTTDESKRSDNEGKSDHKVYSLLFSRV